MGAEAQHAEETIRLTKVTTYAEEICRSVQYVYRKIREGVLEGGNGLITKRSGDAHKAYLISSKRNPSDLANLSKAQQVGPQAALAARKAKAAARKAAKQQHSLTP